MLERKPSILHVPKPSSSSMALWVCLKIVEPPKLLVSFRPPLKSPSKGYPQNRHPKGFPFLQKLLDLARLEPALVFRQPPPQEQQRHWLSCWFPIPQKRRGGGGGGVPEGSQQTAGMARSFSDGPGAGRHRLGAAQGRHPPGGTHLGAHALGGEKRGAKPRPANHPGHFFQVLDG